MSEARDAVIADRFLHEGETDEADVWYRVADAWATSHVERHDFFRMMADGRAFPNTPAIANAGRPIQMGSACFVLPIEDSLEGIMQTAKDAAMVQKAGGGTGFNFGQLRGVGSPVSSTGRAAPGPVAFLKMYSDIFHHITQAGLRPAANMGILPVDHPDVMQFIRCKTEDTIRNFNISVALSDEFMRLPKDRRRSWTSLRGGHYLPGESPEEADRRADVWDAIVDGAWRNGEPGVFFTDTVNRARLHPELYAATNPCGEVPLLPYEACVLGSVNLAAHLSPSYDVTWGQEPLVEYGIDWYGLAGTVRTLVRMLDNIVELQDYPLPIIKETHHRYRKIGVGVMGYADALVLLDVRYGSPEALALAEEWMSFIQDVSYDESRALAVQRGVYPGFEWHSGMPYRRNLNCQVIAPTGTLARLAGCSFSIEPNFAAEYDSFIVGGQFHEVHPLKDHPAFVVAAEVTPAQHILTQAAFQKFTDQAVSKTCNIPFESTREDVAQIYRLAWETGCKGVTVLREGSREDVVIKPGDCVGGVCAL